jgi:hypothetical protein
MKGKKKKKNSPLAQTTHLVSFGPVFNTATLHFFSRPVYLYQILNIIGLFTVGIFGSFSTHFPIIFHFIFIPFISRLKLRMN